MTTTTTPTLSGTNVTYSFDPLAFGPKITPLYNGKFTIAWDSNSPDSDIFGRHFNERGAFTGGDFLRALSAADPKSISSPRLYQQADGKVRVIYQELFAPDNNDIFLHIPDSQKFTPQTNRFPIENTSLNDVLIDATPLATGGGAIAYQKFVGSRRNLVLRMIDSSGNHESNPIYVGANPGQLQQNAAIASVGVDRVAVVYENVNQTTFARDVRLHTYAKNETDISGEVFVSAPNVNAAFPDVITLRDHITSVVAWQQAGGIGFRRYSSAGTPLDATPLLVPNSAGGLLPKITALNNDGGFIIAWTTAVDQETDGSPDLDVVMQRFDASGTAIGTQVNIRDPGDQGLFSMDIATLADGRVVLTYGSETGDSTNITTLNYRIVDPRDSNILGTSWDDNIVGREDASTIESGDGNDKLTGRDGNDVLDAGAGDDTLKGGDGDDTLKGGLGFDVMSGGSGADIFAYKVPGEGGDTITDFTSGVDKLQFVASAFGNLTTTNFDGVSGSAPDITGKELVIFTGGTYASLEYAQTQAIGNSTSAGFFAFTNAANETVLYFDSNGTAAGGSTLVANLGTAAGNLGTADFLFTGTIASPPTGTSTNSGSIVDLTATGNTFPSALNNFGSGAGGYNFTTPVLFTGNAAANNVTGTEFADILHGGYGVNANLLLDPAADADTLNGGSGADLLTGGYGADVFVYKAASEGGDTITDFASGLDKLQFVSGAFGNLTNANFDAVSGSDPDITGKELVLFTPGTYASLEYAQTQAIGNSSSPGFFAFTNAANETVLYFDSNGTAAGGSTLVANFGTAAGSLRTTDFVFTDAIGTSTNSGSIVDLTAVGNTFPSAFNNFGSGAGGYNFTTPVLFTGDPYGNNVTGTEFADILKGDGIVSGGAFGADTFHGGNGADLLTGGLGLDVFVYKASGEGGDTITDFASGYDKLQFVSAAFGNLTTTNFDGVSGSVPDITGKELVIFTGGTYASLEYAQTQAIGNSTNAGFFAFKNAANETVLYFDSNGTTAGGSALIANLGTAVSSLGTADFELTDAIGSPANIVVDLTAIAGTTFPSALNNFGSGAGGYNFTIPVLFTGDRNGNNATGTELADILNGGDGADTLNGGLGNDTISGGEGLDTIFGGGGSDSLLGGLDNDYIFGGDGNDRLYGESGDDTLVGGAGSDTFGFYALPSTKEGIDTIADFTVSDGDKIEISMSGFGATSTNQFSYNSGALYFAGTQFATLQSNSGLLPTVNPNIDIVFVV
jgi:Ca2+-binding RTX toxin-like protein